MHQEEFVPPHSCPKCRRAVAAKPRGSTLPPEIDGAMADEVVMFEGVAEEAAEMAANATSDVAKVAALRVRLSALTKASDIRMARAKANLLDRLSQRRAAGTAAPDPRDDFGTAAPDEMFVAGDN